MFIHSEWLFNGHSVLHHLTHLFGVKFSLTVAVIACARAWHLYTLMQWKWTLDLPVQSLWGIMRNHFCTLSIHHVGEELHISSALERKPQCLALTLRHQPVRLFIWFVNLPLRKTFVFRVISYADLRCLREVWYFWVWFFIVQIGKPKRGKKTLCRAENDFVNQKYGDRKINLVCVNVTKITQAWKHSLC